jgi:ribonuclease R
VKHKKTQNQKQKHKREPGRSPKRHAKPDRSAQNARGERGDRREHGSRGRGAGREHTGRLSMNARGFGFVVTDERGPDVFVPPQALSTAMHGDRVRVQVFPSPKGFDGRVIEVLERAMLYVGGQLRLLPFGSFIEPDDDRLGTRVEVVGKPPAGASDGQGVIAKVVGYPERAGDPLLVEVVETFKAAEFAEFEIRRILLTHAVREDHPEEAVAEARAFGGRASDEERAGREDFRHLPLVTIDPEDARDHDDAVWAERLPDGYRVIVAIADVSHYVAEGTALDAEALARGCTIYLPARAIPMLPRELSSDLASLLPHVDRLALAVDAELDRSGTVRKYRFVECVMRSAARISYGGAARALGLTDAPARQPEAEAHVPLLQTLREIARLLGDKRKARGSFDFDLPEAKVKLDPETREPRDIERSRKDPGIRIAYNLVEELMLLANEVVAADLSQRKLTAIYRVHGTPNEEKLLAFAELARSLGFDVDDETVQKPGKLAHFLAGVAGTPHAEILGYLLLRSMQQATYQTQNIGHFGLAAEDYVHFTSPIRRYPDLAVHRLVRKIARGEGIRGKKMTEQLSEQAAESSRLERRAMLIEREVVDLYRAMLMRDRIGETFAGTITGITEHGIFVAIDAPYVDVLCRTTALPRDRYEVDNYGTRLIGVVSGRSYALFDRIQVRIEDVSIARRRVSAVPVEVEAENEASATPPNGQRPAPAPTSGHGKLQRKRPLAPAAQPRPVLGASGRVGGRKPKTGKHGAQQEQRAEKRRSKDDRRKKRIRKRGG